ncbi:hypothetical protein AD01_5002 [Escherichia coli 2-427-07_S4_C2]|nr:hypothetical protein AD11_5150 [Escherichia coli 1-250-04_S4_C2]KDN05015.1 hypothetical protein DH22_4315 [Escherichia coli]KDX82967.1 hypothetical protein AC46_4996 [Escherichia coli 2-222-05_S3_C3]KDY40340.1 hypothetical protein AD01_5002 [Escherichia coli 2-427-07_S4_C2]KEJ42930.1 hypothetical protein AB65_5777 [Escherichia coli 2-460-02_S1_C3]KEN98171.1 hypothetical protein AB88_5325 [Escherichia coli 2-222-05_S3_C1]KEO42648.1 hypothetical protein AB34_5573 [Escherichia coli 2-460-02_S
MAIRCIQPDRLSRVVTINPLSCTSFSRAVGDFTSRKYQ